MRRAVLAVVSIALLTLLCAALLDVRARQMPMGPQGLPTDLCLGEYEGKLWLVAQSPILSYRPPVLDQPTTRCLVLPANPIVNPIGRWHFPP